MPLLFTARLVALIALLLVTARPALAAGSPPSAPGVFPCREGIPCPPPFPRYFPQTGFTISQDRFWDYFQRRGGPPTFGYPVSQTVRFLGLPTQFFQRQVMQLWPDGSVHLVNLLDSGFMPYATFNFATIPVTDAGLIAEAPNPTDPNYGSEALAFIRDHAPNTWNGLPVNFAQRFFGTVSPQAAFPNQAATSPQVQALLPLVQLEVWGLPTSQPAYDPNNHGFVYLRFQRGVMLYDVSCDCTQGLLFGDYLKAIIVDQHLPVDLAQEASGSRFFAQYAPGQPEWLARPAQLPDTDLTDAFVPPPRPLTGQQDCGSLTVAGATQRPTNAATAQAAEGCFAAALPACTPATLSVTWMGVDAGDQRTFTLTPSAGGCTIGDRVQHYVVPFPARPGSSASYTCTSATAAADGLHFTGCGADGDLMVPAPA